MKKSPLQTSRAALCMHFLLLTYIEVTRLVKVASARLQFLSTHMFSSVSPDQSSSFLKCLLCISSIYRSFFLSAHFLCLSNFYREPAEALFSVCVFKKPFLGRFCASVA